MKKIVFTLFTLFLALPVCADSEEDITDFLNRVYTKVASIKSTGEGSYESLIDRYCSQKFCKFYKEIRRWEGKLGEPILGHGSGAYDIFIQYQDHFDRLGFCVSSVQKTSSYPEEIYSAAITKFFYSNNYDKSVWSTTEKLYVIYENGGWKIHDFKDGEYTLALMKKHLPIAISNYTNSDKKQVTDLLERVYEEMTRLANNRTLNTLTQTNKYCSKRFRELHDEVVYLENKYSVMIYDGNCWTRACGRDWDKIDYKISNVKITGLSTAVADVTLIFINGSSQSSEKIRLDLIFENNKWVIDDFTNYYSDDSFFQSDSKIYKEEILRFIKSLEEHLDFLKVYI